MKIYQKKKLKDGLIYLKKNGEKNILLLLNLGEINGIIYSIISNTQNRLEKLFIRLILLNQFIDNLKNSLKQKVLFQMKIAY